MVGWLTGDNVFQDRLNELFDAADPRPTNATVAEGLLAHGCQISKPYLSQLRCGVRTNPSDDVVAAFAAYFGVSPDYFFSTSRSDDSHAQVKHEVDQDTETIRKLANPVIKRLLTAANGLTAASLGLLADMSTKLRVSEHHRLVPADSPSYTRLTETSRPSSR